MDLDHHSRVSKSCGPQPPLEFEALPAEMKMEIFNYLDFEDRKSGRLVNKTFSELLSSTFSFVCSLTDSSAKVMLNSSRKITTLMVQDLSPLALPLSSKRALPLEKVEMLHLKGSVAEDNVLKLLRYCPKVSTLVFHLPCRISLQHLSSVGASYQLESLSELKLQFPHFQPYQAQFLKKLTESCPLFVNLTQVDFSWHYPEFQFQLYQNANAASFYEAYIYIHKFIVKHSKTLYSVDVDLSEVRCRRSTCETISAALIKKRHEIIHCTPTDEIFMLRIKAHSREGEYPWDLNACLYKNLKRMYQLDLNFFEVDIPRNLMAYDSVLYCNKSLRELTLTLPNDMTLDCRSLAGCTNLETFYSETTVPVVNVRQLPTKNLVRLTFEGRPSFCSEDRKWLARKLCTVENLAINFNPHPILGYAFDNELDLFEDFKRFLMIRQIKRFSIVILEWIKYARIVVVAGHLGYAHYIFNCKHGIGFQFEKLEWM